MKKYTIYLAFLFTIICNCLFAQQKKATPNFYQIRESVLKKISEDKTKGNVSEEARENDDILTKFHRWEHFVEERVYPTGDFFEPDVIMKSYNNYYNKHTKNSSVASGNWQPVGPYFPVTDASQLGIGGIGRINCLAQHPTDSNTLYIGTMGGGIWKTIDGGQSWVSLAENLPSMSFSDIAINPLYPDTIYAATGDAIGNYALAAYPDFHQGQYSSGIIMSPDGGQTWMQTGFTFQQYHKPLYYPFEPRLHLHRSI